MSFRVSLMLYCDGPALGSEDCQQDGSPLNCAINSEATRRAEWEHAKRQGWKRRGNSHLCPSCASVVRRKAAKRAAQAKDSRHD